MSYVIILYIFGYNEILLSRFEYVTHILIFLQIVRNQLTADCRCPRPVMSQHVWKKKHTRTKAKDKRRARVTYPPPDAESH